MGEHLSVLCFTFRMIDDFLYSCGECKLSNGELPHVMVGMEYEGRWAGTEQA
jgi:hypothetical protein